MTLYCCACTTVLIVPAPFRIVAQFRDAARGDASRREASRTGGLGAIAGGLEGGTARPTSTVIHPSRLPFKMPQKRPSVPQKHPSVASPFPSTCACHGSPPSCHDE